MGGSLAALSACALACVAQGQTPKAQTETVLYSFCSQKNCADGEYPEGSVIHVNGTLYGTTTIGGAYRYGTVFSLNLHTGAEAVLYSFCPIEGPCTDGAIPETSLVNIKGTLYGTTAAGGANWGYSGSCGQEFGCGTVFSLNRRTGAEAVLYSFCSERYCRDGYWPEGNVINIGSSLYGTTYYGGKHTCHYGYGKGCGTVFSLHPKTGAETVLHSFVSSRAHPTDGRFPDSGMIDVDGLLYGTTLDGGTSPDGGTVFSVVPTTGAEIAYSLSSGGSPGGGLIDLKGMLYGTLGLGGTYGKGVVFLFNPKTGAQTVLYSFCSQQDCTDGSEPSGGVIDVGGRLYGTTTSGGKYDAGTVFSLDPNTGAETVIYSFCSKAACADGEYPSYAMIKLNGTLYGVTTYGGAHNAGTVFSIVP